MATVNQLSSQINVLHQDIKDLLHLVYALSERLDIPGNAVRHVERDGEVFVPGTGWTGSGTLSADARAALEALELADASGERMTDTNDQQETK